MTGLTPTDDGYFERVWSASEDPWDHAGRFYERRKYALTEAMLDRPRFRSAFEPGCGIGLLTERLADRTDQLLAWDRHPRAVEVTSRRTARSAHVTVAVGQLPQWPAGPFDLVVLSEVLYYLTPPQVDEVGARVLDSTAPGSLLVAAHFRRDVPEHAQPGDTVQQAVCELTGFEHRGRYIDDDVVIDALVRR